MYLCDGVVVLLCQSQPIGRVISMTIKSCTQREVRNKQKESREKRGKGERPALKRMSCGANRMRPWMMRWEKAEMKVLLVALRRRGTFTTLSNDSVPVALSHDPHSANNC